MKTTVFLLAAALAAAPLVTRAADAAKPNVVFILADDLGWGDLSCHGSTWIKTPNLDRLAAEGTDFRRFYTASPVCSPSRVGFMTGQFPARFGVRSAIGGVQKNREIPQVDWLDPQAVMLPRLLKESGYATGHCGKWHLQSAQSADAPLPPAYGIDESALFNGTSHPDQEPKIKDAEIWDAAIAFIKRHREQPFYLNVWLHETHLAHYPTPESMEANKHLNEQQQVYAAVARDADLGVGRILAALKETGIESNTIVVFSSDNGPENTNRSKEMRGGYGGYYSVGETGGKKGRKRSLHDGGVSTAFLVKWPGHVPAGRVDETTVLSATDLLPTICAAVKVELPKGYEGDGESMLAAWEGQGKARTKPIFWDWTGADNPPTNWCRWSVRDGDWKLLIDNGGRMELYNMKDDAGEAKNLAEQQPDTAQRLKELLDKWKQSLPKDLPSHCLSKVRARGRAADE